MKKNYNIFTKNELLILIREYENACNFSKDCAPFNILISIRKKIIRKKWNENQKIDRKLNKQYSESHNCKIFHLIMENNKDFERLWTEYTKIDKHYSL